MIGYFLIFIVLFSCENKESQNTQEYLFLGHTYQWGVKENNRIDYRFKDFDFKKYKQLWLGGDLCAQTDEELETLAYLDSIFDLSSKTTHWALGNHDVLGKGTLDWIEATTKRKTFYTSSFNDICLAVLNTTEFHHPNYRPKPFECEVLDGQIQMLQNISDTIQNVSHLLVLHHYCFLTNEQYKDSVDLGSIFNLYVPELKVDCANEHTFKSRMLPIFQKVQNKGVQVVFVSGDLGQRSKAFEYQTEDGMWFLGSGINNSAVDIYVPEYVTDTTTDQVLIFEHEVKERKLKWRFEPLEELVE